MGSEVYDLKTIIVNIILLTALIFFATYLLGLRNDMGEVWSMQIRSKAVLADTYKFNVYQKDRVYGEDVVSAIRGLLDQGIDVAVRQNGSHAFSCSVSGEVKVATGFYHFSEMDALRCPEMISIDTLSSLFPVSYAYKPVLAYGGVALDTLSASDAQPAVYSNVTGVLFIYDGLRTNP